EVEQADGVRDRRPALAAPAGQLGLADSEVLYRRRAGARLVDRVQVLARDVLEQSELEALGAFRVTNDRGHLVELRDPRRAQPPLAGDQLVGATRQRAHHQRLQDAARLDRLGQRQPRLAVELLARLVRVGTDQLDRYLAQRRLGLGAAGGAGQDRREPAAHAT